MKKKYWYHCSTLNHGSSFIVKKHIPQGIPNKEPNVPRLCVCPTIALCFCARLFEYKTVYVYRTKFQCKANAPKGVWDITVTRERWLVPPVEMILIKTIDKETVIKATELIRQYHKLKKKNSNLRLRVCQYGIVTKLIGTDWDKRNAHNMLEILKITCPETYIMELICK